MPVKLFVGGLSFSTSNDSLRDAFARFGTVNSAVVMTDRETGRSRGFGFVEMGTDQEAERAIGGLNGFTLDGRMIRVDKATPRGAGPVRRPGGPPPPRTGPGGFSAGRPSGGRPSGGFSQPAGGLDTRGGGRGDSRGAGRPGRGGDRRRGAEGEQRKPGGPRRGKPGNERRSEDKGRRGEDRW